MAAFAGQTGLTDYSDTRVRSVVQEKEYLVMKKIQVLFLQVRAVDVKVIKQHRGLSPERIFFPTPVRGVGIDLSFPGACHGHLRWKTLNSRLIANISSRGSGFFIDGDFASAVGDTFALVFGFFIDCIKDFIPSCTLGKCPSTPGIVGPARPAR